MIIANKFLHVETTAWASLPSRGSEGAVQNVLVMSDRSLARINLCGEEMMFGRELAAKDPFDVRQTPANGLLLRTHLARCIVKRSYC